MTEKRVYYDCVGPFFYDDTEDLFDSEGIFTDRLQNAITTDGNILIIGGGGLILEGAASYGGAALKFVGSSYTTQLLVSQTGNLLYILPETNDDVSLYLGVEPLSATPTWGRFNTIVNACTQVMSIDIKDGSNVGGFSFYYSYGAPHNDKTIDWGISGNAWDDVYADDFQNVADFLLLDSRDDLAELEKIQGSGVIDPRTGEEVIDDNTVPEWLLTKCKNTGVVLKGPDGKPFIALKTIISLLMGACKQLNSKVKDLETKLKEVKDA
jgi:hypothetical protein